MRRMVDYPAGQKISPPLLREAGDSTTNHTKEDDNLAKSTAVWDASSAQAHWKNRPAGQPFFAVVNSTKSHESQTIKPRATPVHDPAKVPVPAYHPDTPEVRRDWALHYDSVTAAAAGVVLAQLAADGLAEDTIIFYRADHGSGLPRSKRWPSNSGLHVPLLVPIPENFQDLRPADYVAGRTTDRPVSLVDFAPTLRSLAGLQPLAWMQGYAFLGKFIAPAQPYVYGFRGRMDERYDLVRRVTAGRYVYLRNDLPHLSKGQHVAPPPKPSVNSARSLISPPRSPCSRHLPTGSKTTCLRPSPRCTPSQPSASIKSPPPATPFSLSPPPARRRTPDTLPPSRAFSPTSAPTSVPPPRPPGRQKNKT